VGTAPNGRIALQKLTQVNPDIITMDVEMPEMDGVQTVRELRRTHPRLPVIMFSALTQKGASATLDALAAGATDYVTKPMDVVDLHDSIERLQQELLPKIQAHFRPEVPVAPKPFVPSRLFAPVPASGGPVDLICIGSSTGGPVALETLMKGFTAPLPVPVAIVQHMPPMFTHMLAQRLNALPGPIRCKEASAGMILQAGCAYIAPGGSHLALFRDTSGTFSCRITNAPPENSCRPSVDVMFRSAAATNANLLGVILTGMGQDGLRGCEYIHERKGQVVVQDEATSVVWGMPGAVAQANLAHAILPLESIAAEITRRVKLTSKLR
jgi:two-component system chemotaxis response regulator CheB